MPNTSIHTPIAGTQPISPPTAVAPESLTAREQEVLHLLAQGCPSKEIATRLVITERMAKFHVISLMGKFGATNRTE